MDTQHNAAKVLNAYRNYLLSKVSKVRILGEPDERELKDVFVQLSMVDQHTPQQRSEFLGLMDSAMRRRLNPFQTQTAAMLPELWEQHEKKTRRRIEPDELLQRRTKAIVTGAPGCGKTTLLKYLALQALEKEKRLTIWIELKAIDKPLFAQAEEVAVREGNLILVELWLKHLKTQLSLSDADTQLLREHWREKFKANEIAVLLDGFDELQDEAIEHSLNKCVREFASASHDNTLLISTRPYAQHKLGKELLQELEIEPLDQRQIEAFLNCYYPKDAATKSLLKALRERSSVRELLHVPLLLGVILRLHRENRFTDDRLELYETIIGDLIHELDRSKSVMRQFKINNERLRLDFLKFLAFDLLLRDPLGKEEQEVSRIVFSYNVLKEKARAFLAQDHSAHNPRDLADDALSTPLLRGVRTDTFAFTHLTLQEYLAAREFAAFYKNNELEGLKIFCRAYHNTTIVEMEVLPMMLGALKSVEKLYGEIQQWSDSLNLIGLRLRLRGLSYCSNIDQTILVNLINEFEELLVEKRASDTLYCDIVASSLSGIHGNVEIYVIERIARLLKDQNNPARWRAARALGLIRSSHALEPLLESLNDTNEFVRAKAAEALTLISSEETVSSLLKALKDENPFVRWNVATALGNIKSTQATEPLICALASETDDYARGGLIDALGEIGDEGAIDTLSFELKKSKEGEGWHASEALVKIGGRGIRELITSVISDDKQIRWSAFSALPDNLPPEVSKALSDVEFDETLLAGTPYSCLLEVGEYSAAQEVLVLAKKMLSGQLMEHDAAAAVRRSPVVAPGLLKALRHRDGHVRANAAEALGVVEDHRAVVPLLKALQDEDSVVREKAAEALGQIKSPLACDALANALDDKNESVRKHAAIGIGASCKDGSDELVEKLATLVSSERNNIIRWNLIIALGQIGGEQAVFTLLTVLLFGRTLADKERAIEYLSLAKQSDLKGALEIALYADNALVRSKAAQIIGYYTTASRVLEKLDHLSQMDEDTGVRNAAKEAAAKFVRKLELLGFIISEETKQSLGDNESKEGVSFGEVQTIVSQAGHIYRRIPPPDWGLDVEVEFKNDKGEASGQRVYLQLKSGDSYLYKRKSDGKEIFNIKNPRHIVYWLDQAYPVLLVIRDSGGQIRWMNVTEYLRLQGTNITQIEFQGEPFTAESVRQMRTRFSR
jgi:HEAT repeat protein/type II secretory pathway predicted ATPase ExeA